MNFTESKAIYLQIAGRICDEIVQQVYATDQRIPSVREYAALVEVNTNTAMRSFDYLQTAGILYNKRGIGYFVSQQAAETIHALRRERFLTVELPEVFRQASLLGLTPDELKERFTQYTQPK
jgi:DNA-binding transcriptional regulator YhcF (GntR family)